MCGGIGTGTVKSGVSGNGFPVVGAAAEAVYVFVSPMNSSKSSHTRRTGTLKKWESMKALSMVG